MARIPRGAAPGSFVVAAPGTPPTAAHLDAPSQATDDILADLEEERSRPPEARIHRLNPITRKFGFLDQVDASIADEGWIRETYGGGDYRILTYGTRADQTWGYLKGKMERVSVDTSIPFKGSLRERVAQGALPEKARRGASEDEPDPDMRDLFKSQLLGLVREQSDNRNSLASVIAGMMQQQATAMQGFMTAMTALMQRPEPRGGGLGELKDILGPLITGISSKKDPAEIAATLMAAMKDQPGQAARDPFKMFKEFLEIRDLMGSGNKDSDNETDPWLRIVEKTLPGVVDVLKAESEKTGQPIRDIAVGRVNVPRLAQHVGSGSASAPSSESPGSSPSSGPIASAPMHPADQWTPLEPHAAQLAAFARQNKEPYGVMHLILTVAPSEVLATMREVVAREDCVAFLMERFPILAPHQAWTAQLVEAFRGELFGEDEDEAEPETTTEPPPQEPAT